MRPRCGRSPQTREGWQPSLNTHSRRSTASTPSRGTATSFGLHVGRIDIAQFAVNATGRIAEEGWQTVDLHFTEETFLRVSEERIPYKVRLPVKGDVAEVVLAVYDAKADKVGTARQGLR